MKALEKGIPLANFAEEAQKKDLDMEYRLLTRLNCHKQQYTSLCKSRVVQFSSRNRYSEILPFMFNQVKLKSTENQDKHADYINASYVDVSSLLSLSDAVTGAGQEGIYSDLGAHRGHN